MPPACTRNRAILYGVPSLAVAPAVVCHWAGFHAWRHFLRLESLLHPADRLPLWRAVVDFHWRTLPLTLLSLFGFGIIWRVWPVLLQGSGHRIVAYLLLLSALTVPHALVIGWLDGRERMKDEGGETNVTCSGI